MWITAAAPRLARSWGLRWRPLNGSPGAESLRLSGAPVLVELDASADQDFHRVAGVGVVVPAKVEAKGAVPVEDPVGVRQIEIPGEVVGGRLGGGDNELGEVAIGGPAARRQGV
jgi:hypothetical protein